MAELCSAAGHILTCLSLVHEPISRPKMLDSMYEHLDLQQCNAALLLVMQVN